MKKKEKIPRSVFDGGDKLRNKAAFEHILMTDMHEKVVACSIHNCTLLSDVRLMMIMTN
jgi:hypothetical protein